MKKQTYLFLSSVVLALISQTLSAKEDTEYSYEKAQRLLVASLEHAQLSAEKFKHTSLLSFTREKVDRDGEIESYRYMPKINSEGVWQKLDTKYSTNRHDSKVWENDVIFSPDSFKFENAKLLKEGSGVLLFDMPVHLDLTVDSDAVDEKNEHLDTFRAEVSVNAGRGLINSFRIYSIKEFSPQFGVTVTSYESNSILKELAAGGPFVITEQSESIRGDFGFFISLDEDTKITNFDFAIDKNSLEKTY